VTTFVLVHGSHCGGWVWQKVSTLLRARGHEVYSPTLTGLSYRSHLANCGINLTTHITEIANLLIYEDLSNVILVGHSYGGMVITGVAAMLPERLRLLVYLDAYVPADGQSEADLLPAEMRLARLTDATAHAGMIEPPAPAVLGITDPEMVEWVKRRWTPQPLATYTEPVQGTNASGAAPRGAFIHCMGGPTTTTPGFAPFAAKARADGWQVGELATGHMAMLTAPVELTAMLIEFADANQLSKE
jgi:pimeloyl-ACP methyl ester carboxylesterase